MVATRKREIGEGEKSIRALTHPYVGLILREFTLVVFP